VPTTQEIVATNPLMPGLEMHIPAGVRLRTHNGTYLTSLALTPVPLDRTPLPLPPGTAYYFTPQTHDSVIETVDGRPSAGIRIVFPNVSHLPPGTQVDLYDYSSEKGWYVYGQGTVTRDGKQVGPNPGVGLQKLNCNNSMANPYPPGSAPPPGGGTSAGDPVDLATGLFVYRKTDLVLPDTIPITLTRTYRQDATAGSFGPGNTHPYEMYLWFGFWSYVDLILPDGGKIHYDETSPGTQVFQHTATPTKFYKSTLTKDPDGNYSLKLLDGTTYHFFSALVCCNQFTHQYKTGLDWIQDRYGNKLTIVRDTAYQIQKIVSPNGRWISFTYNGSGYITQARDSVGRTVSYAYDANYRLTDVTDVNNGNTHYTWDPYYSRMLTIRDPRNIVYITNEYDSNGRVSKQTQADTGFYQFAYTLDGNGKVTQTDVTDPRGFVRRSTFNSSGYTLTDTFALGRPEQQVYTYTRQACTNLITNVLDPLGRNTATAYDSQGNVTSFTRLAGTADAVMATLTYESTFNQLATVTDPLNHTVSFGYDSLGNLTSITDALIHQTTLTYNSAGQVLTATDPLQRTVQFAYDSGDLVSVTDALNRTVTRYVDGAGRTTRATDALGSVRRYEFDSLNQIVRGTDPLQGVTTLAHDPNGNVLTVTDARNNVTTFIYDNVNRVATRRDPLLHDETYQYDLNGNLHQVTDRKSQVTSFGYDALDRLTQVTYADTSTTNYTYDAGNRLTQIVDSIRNNQLRLRQLGSPDKRNNTAGQHLLYVRRGGSLHQHDCRRADDG
jgi:YD repeat-containing protein